MAFRQIGNTPYLWVYIFGCEYYEYNDAISYRILNVENQNLPPEGSFETRTALFSNFDYYDMEEKITRLHSGIVCPDQDGEHFMGIIKGPHQKPSPLLIRIFPFIRPRKEALQRKAEKASTDEERYYYGLYQKTFSDFFESMETEGDLVWDYFYLNAQGMTYTDELDESVTIMPEYKRLQEEISPPTGLLMDLIGKDWQNFNLKMYALKCPYIQKAVTSFPLPKIG